ncbi:uncharacterized protein LOC107622199 isoform X2 [Arachis ipaensis]|uniref:uncharacterized protein LOC107622199 isoform X2 n=1 Tax=Arachis ipaensis TaxID=130454 RepID=UPI000A2B44D0|nr:uncharacterized protein LOC107622199 isoform X2 [Arachis ipaensis]
MFLNMLNVLEISLISVFGDSIDRVTDLISMFPSQWFAPVCIDRHWWLYAFEIYQKRLWVLDSMYIGEPSNERLKIHAYAGRIIEDMAKVTMPAYEHTKDGLPRFYPSVPRQDNGTLYRSLGRRSY